MFYYFFIFLTFLFGSICAEIVNVNIQWQSQTCPLTCAQNLASQFQKIPGVAEIVMNTKGGYANLRWRPGVPFYYAQIKGAMQAVGSGIDDIRIKVRGTLRFEKQTVSLTSLGDNSVFYLLGPLIAGQGMTVYNSLENHQLSKETLARLVEGYQQNRIAVVEGPLFQPWRYPYLWLVIDTLQFVQSESK